MPKWTEEQQLAIDKDKTNIIVSAGAGSGKTAVLTARVIRKLKNHVNINELLILTFTKKAAHEMKERIRLSILEDASLKEQLSYIDSSYITTFDSFALSVVKKYHYLLNISKNVKIADSSTIYLQKMKNIDSIFMDLYYQKDDRFLTLIDDFTIKDDKDIKKYILDISNKLDLKYDKLDYLDHYVENYYSDENMNSMLLEYQNLLQEKINSINNLLTEFSNYVDTDYFYEVSNLFSCLLASSSYDEVKKHILIKLPNLPKNSSEEAKSIKNRISKILDQIENLVRFSDYQELKDSFLSTKNYAFVVVDIIKKLDLQLNYFKNNHNLYEFTDISKMAIKILKENEEVKKEMKSFFKEIMIDEYQDTSDLQEEFISMIENNNVYMVGDIKQSIYRFRNANPYLFKSKYDSYSLNNGGFKIDLTRNFRSRLEVIDNVNLIFSKLMNDHFGGADYQKSHKMIFGNSSYVEEGKTEQNHNLEIFHYDFSKSFGYTKEEIEIFIIAQDIKEKVEGKYQIFDKEKKVLRDATYGDFAILLDKSVNFGLYKKIFEYLKIPMTKYTSTNITDEIEIILIKNILKLIISAKQKKYDVEFRYAFMSVIRSYLFECSDSLIFEYFQKENFQDSALMKLVDSIASRVDSLSLLEVITLIIDEFSFYSKQVKMGDVKNRINRIMAIVDIFNNLADIGYSIFDAYQYLELLIEEGYKLEIKETDVISNSVKIMTIHASKGLEFPICYFASLHSEFNIKELNEKFLYNNKYGMIMPYFKEGIGKVFVKDLLKEEYMNEEISEKIRLFYVALTRAKEKMIMVSSFDDDNIVAMNECRSFLDMLYLVKDDISQYIRNIDINSIFLTKDYDLIKKYNYKDSIKETDSKLEIRDIVITEEFVGQNRISKRSDSLLDKDTKEKIAFGKSIHKVLEYMDFKNFNIEDLDLPPFYKNGIYHFMKMIHKDQLVHVYKEYEFSFENAGLYEHGIIDLILEYNDRIMIIDYKLKNIDDDDYVKQIMRYHSYLSTKTDKKVESYLFSIADCVLKKIK